MKTFVSLLVAGIACAATTLLFAGPAGASTPESASSGRGAVFVQTDNLSGNAIVAYSRGGNGALRQVGNYPTGGNGGALDGSVVDHLASQGSLALDQRAGLLYAVNAGSNTITVFSVSGDKLARRQVINSGGTFPVSIAVHDHLVYVANALAGGSVQGFYRVGDHLVRVPAWHRSLGLDPAAAPQFVNTPGQVAFNPSGTQLVVTTKANGNHIDVFGIGKHGAPSAHAKVNTRPGTVPFSVNFDRAGHLVIAEAGTNAVSSFTLDRNGVVHPISSAATGGAATCWVTIVGQTIYASNAGSGTVSSVHTSHGGKLALTATTSTDGGTVDAAASSDGRFLYVQTGATGVVDEFAVSRTGGLTSIGAVTVPGAVGGEGIVAS